LRRLNNRLRRTWPQWHCDVRSTNQLVTNGGCRRKERTPYDVVYTQARRAFRPAEDQVARPDTRRTRSWNTSCRARSTVVASLVLWVRSNHWRFDCLHRTAPLAVEPQTGCSPRCRSRHFAISVTTSHKLSCVTGREQPSCTTCASPLNPETNAVVLPDSV
jgi:hypothetical protein